MVSGMNPLEQIPWVELRVRDYANKTWVFAKVDGDYDGEYFAQYRWWLVNGYVASRDTRNGVPRVSKTGRKYLWFDYQYLHNLVLPVKPGYRVQFINGDRLDCRSANLEYVRTSDHAYFGYTKREERIRRMYGRN